MHRPQLLSPYVANPFPQQKSGPHADAQETFLQAHSGPGPRVIFQIVSAFRWPSLRSSRPRRMAARPLKT